MKKIFSASLFIFILPSFLLFGWGDKGHKIIASFAMKLLPEEIKLSDQMKFAIIEHSLDPDNRKKGDRSEGPKHFIDIDRYKEFLDGKMITSRDTLNKIYGDSLVTKEGVLPWATEETFNKLVNAFKEKDKQKIILYASDLAHYVGDGHQPLHATINYNGQLTSQKGVHFRYEVEMIDRNLIEIEKKFVEQKSFYIQNISEYVFDYITEANNYAGTILSADRYCSAKSGGKPNEDYYRLFWFKTKYITVNEINSAALGLSSLIYTAWVDAGKPVLED